MTACAYRLAPVQIKWVGMQNHSSGLAEMDWIITDRWETPPELEHVYSERQLRLPDGYVCYTTSPYAPDVGPLPALSNGHITFGCFNNLAKITPRVIATWCTILHRLPNARLVLKTHQFADAPTVERVLAVFAAHGIPPSRLEIARPIRASRIPRRIQRHRHRAGPVPLFRRSDHLRGAVDGRADGHGARRDLRLAPFHEPSEQRRACADWVAPDVAAYVELAVAKASDLPALAALRSGLRARVKASPLCDAPRFGRNLGAALRFAWQDWCGRG